MQLCGDLCFYWHIRGKNISAREYAAAFLDADAARSPTLGRAGALITAGLASWMLGQLERSKEEHSEAYRIATELGADRERCVAAFLGAIALIGLDLEAARELAGDAVAHSRARGLVWAEGFASSIDGIVRTVAGDVDAAHARYTRALEIQQQLGDDEGAGLSLGGLAQLAAMRGDLSESLDLYRRSLAAFEAIGDRAEEARILSEMAWTHLRDENMTLARRYFLDSVQAYTDVASVRGVGLSLIGLGGDGDGRGRPENAVQIAAAAEVYAQRRGHRQRLLRRDAGTRVRRPGASSSLGRRCRPRD